jgi:hypothetical protein
MKDEKTPLDKFEDILGARVSGELQVMTQPVGPSTLQKLAFCEHAIVEMASAHGKNKDLFRYHFGAFLALLGTVRLYLKPDDRSHPEREWIFKFDDSVDGALGGGLDYALAIGLRNVDVHVGDTTQQNTTVTFPLPRLQPVQRMC